MFKGPVGGACWRPSTFLFVLLFSPPAFGGTKSNAAIEAYNQAVKHVNASQYEHASDFASRALSIDSQFAEAYYLRAVCRYSLKAVDSAQMDLGDALRIDSSLTDARALRALIHYEKDEYDSALEDLNGVLVKKPDDAQSLLIRGIIHMKREEKNPAIRDLRAFLKLRPNDPLAPRLKEALSVMGGATGSAPDRPAAVGRRLTSSGSSGVKQRVSEEGPTAKGAIRTRELADKFGHQLLRGDAGPVGGDIEKRRIIQSEEN